VAKAQQVWGRIKRAPSHPDCGGVLHISLIRRGG